MGARGQREFPDERDPDRIRVLCFGESFTFGAEVGDGPHDALLATLGPDDSPEGITP